jgi:hypothetical protein
MLTAANKKKAMSRNITIHADKAKMVKNTFKRTKKTDQNTAKRAGIT